jgi:hypothetical protein
MGSGTAPDVDGFSSTYRRRGDGLINRKYGLGREKLDLMVSWKGNRYAIEVKMRRNERTEWPGLTSEPKNDHPPLDEHLIDTPRAQYAFCPMIQLSDASFAQAGLCLRR